MKKPEGVGEWDGYPMPNISPNKKPLTKEEEDKIIEELHRRAQKRLSKQAGEQNDDQKAV